MNEHDEQLRQAVALFRYGLIADLAHLQPGTRGIGAAGSMRCTRNGARTWAGPGAWRRMLGRRCVPMRVANRGVLMLMSMLK